ncbi:MAG: hypothetical protein ACI90V_008357 [Bacillariaceae sp.]|jgi:hypothetical protein
MYDPILLIYQVVLIIDVFFSIKQMIQYQKGLKKGIKRNNQAQYGNIVVRVIFLS